MFSLIAKLLVFQFLGELIGRTLAINIPGPVTGLLLMLIYLFARRDEAERMAPACNRLLSHLALFFVPAATGLMTQIEILANDSLAIVVALVVSTFTSIIVTAGVIHRLSR